MKRTLELTEGEFVGLINEHSDILKVEPVISRSPHFLLNNKIFEAISTIRQDTTEKKDAFMRITTLRFKESLKANDIKTIKSYFGEEDFLQRLFPSFVQWVIFNTNACPNKTDQQMQSRRSLIFQTLFELYHVQLLHNPESMSSLDKQLIDAFKLKNKYIGEEEEGINRMKFDFILCAIDRNLPCHPWLQAIDIIKLDKDPHHQLTDPFVSSHCNVKTLTTLFDALKQDTKSKEMNVELGLLLDKEGKDNTLFNAFTEMLRQNKSITSLTFRDADASIRIIKPEAIALLVEAIQVNTTLSILRLQEVALAEEGMPHIVTLIKKNNLTEISFSFVGTRYKREPLFNALADNNTLTNFQCYICPSSGPISEASALAIAKHKTLNAIRIIEYVDDSLAPTISNQDWTEIVKGYERLANALEQHNTTLTTIDIHAGFEQLFGEFDDKPELATLGAWLGTIEKKFHSIQQRNQELAPQISLMNTTDLPIVRQTITEQSCLSPEDKKRADESLLCMTEVPSEIVSNIIRHVAVINWQENIIGQREQKMREKENQPDIR